MNAIIQQLSQIEASAVAILSDSSEKKKALTAEYEEKTRRFDQESGEAVEKKISALRAAAEKEAALREKEQEEAKNASISHLEKHYETNRRSYIKRLFQEITEV